MTRRLLAFDRIRVIELRRRVRETVERFESISSNEPAADDAIATVRRIGHRLGTEWIPYLSRLAADTSMVDWSVDRNGDGELSWEELVAGADHDDPDTAATCRFLLEHPLAFVNTALSGADYSVGDVDDLSIDDLEDGGWEFDMDGDLALWQYLTITPDALAAAVEQNRHLRTLAEPDVFAAADAAAGGGAIDGRVSRDDLAALIDLTDDRDVIAMCRHFVDHPDAFERIDRESPRTGFDGTIAYDQLFELGMNQGALIGVPDPTIPAALRARYVDPGDRPVAGTEFLHHPIGPQPGRGQVVIALYDPGRRGPDAVAHPGDSTLHLIIDYELGVVTVRIPPSTGLVGGASDALPIVTETGTGAMWLGRLSPAGDSNHVHIAVDADGSIDVDLAVLNAADRHLAPWLNARFAVSPAPGDEVRLVWVRDPFPAMEAYHVYPGGGVVTLADDDAEWGPVVGLLSDMDDSAGLTVG